MTSRPAPLSKAPDARAWLARRRGSAGEDPTGPHEETGDGAELVLVDLAAASKALFEIEARTPRLSDDDETRIARISDREARDHRRAAHIALRVMLERHAGAIVRRRAYRIGPRGKPELDITRPAPESSGDTSSAHSVAALAIPQFSLSHTSGLALIGVSSRHPLGVDLEAHRASRIMGERRLAIERAAIDLAAGAPLPEHDRDARFLTAWVRLEAVAKADGLGLGAHLSVILGRRTMAVTSGHGSAGDRVTARDVALGPGLYAAYAAPNLEKPPDHQEFPATIAGIEALLQENAAGGGTSR